MSDTTRTGPLKLYASYSFTDKDPIIDRLRSVVQASKESYTRIGADSGVSPQTLHQWFHGKTLRPQFATVAAVFGALGFDVLPVARGSGKVVPLHAVKNGRARKAG